MLEIETQQLEYFIAASEQGSMSKAATSLFVSQQALSKGIQTLERALGEHLFIRSKTGVTLTDFGCFFSERAIKALHDLRACSRCRDDWIEGAHRQITIGIAPMCFIEQGGSLEVQQVLQMESQYPVEFSFIELTPDAIRKRVVEGDLDFGFTVSAEWPRFGRRFLNTYPMAVLVSRKNILSRQASITPANLRTCEVVVPVGDSHIERFLRALGEVQGFKMRLSPHHLNPRDGAELITSRDTVTIRPLQHALRTTNVDEVAVLPLVDSYGEAIKEPLFLVWERGRCMSDADLGLVETIVRLYAQAHETQTPISVI